MSNHTDKVQTVNDEKTKAHTSEGQADNSIAPRKSSLEADKDATKHETKANGSEEEVKELDANQNGRRGSKKISSISNLDDKKPGSPEFGSLKDIDGNVIRHDESMEEEEEDPNQRVHFNLENTEEVEDETSQPHPNKKPRKSILKRSLSFKSGGSADKKEPQNDNADQTHEEADAGLDKHVKDSIEFLTVWKEIKHDLQAVERFFLNQAKPEDFITIFAHGIETELLSEIIETTNSLSETNSSLALKVLEKLTEVKDFEAVSKLLSDKEKISIHRIFLKLRTNLNLGEESLTSISGKYLTT